MLTEYITYTNVSPHRKMFIRSRELNVRRIKYNILISDQDVESLDKKLNKEPPHKY